MAGAIVDLRECVTGGVDTHLTRSSSPWPWPRRVRGLKWPWNLYGYYWATDLLQENGASVHLVHPLGLHWDSGFILPPC